MLTAKEQKIVVATLTKRRAWLKNALEDSSLEKSVRGDYIEMVELLDSAMRKLAASIAKPANTQPPAPPKKKIATPKRVREPKKVTLNNARILVAEDNKDSADLLMELLEDIGFKLVDRAEDGIEAFDKIKGAEEPFDLILCDWDMPGLNGLEVHSRAKASNTLREAHFIMVTAVSEATRIRQAIQQGISDYIVKPVDVDKLEQKIKAALKLNAAEKEASED